MTRVLAARASRNHPAGWPICTERPGPRSLRAKAARAARWRPSDIRDPWIPWSPAAQEHPSRWFNRLQV